MDSNYFPNYSTGVGSFFVSFFPISWLELQGYGHRKVSYSLTIANPYFFENRIGGKINIQLGPRILISGYGLTGPNNYPRANPSSIDGDIEFSNGATKPGSTGEAFRSSSTGRSF